MGNKGGCLLPRNRNILCLCYSGGNQSFISRVHLSVIQTELERARFSSWLCGVCVCGVSLDPLAFFHSVNSVAPSALSQNVSITSLY